MKKNIHLIGIGMGNPDTLTLAAVKCLEKAEIVIGAKRIIESVKNLVNSNCEFFENYKTSEIVEKIKNSLFKEIVCVFSGDTGFYSGAEKLSETIELSEENDGDYLIEFIPGITSAQYMAAKFGENWQDWNLVSAHGTECNFEAEIAHNKKTFFLTGGKITVKTILEFLMNNEIPCRVCIGNRMSYEDETLTSFYMNVETHNLTVELKKIMAERNSGFLEDSNKCDLACILVENFSFDDCEKCDSGSGALDDELFIRNCSNNCDNGNKEKLVPMTKKIVRSSILSLLNLKDKETVWDVGAGTGSVTIDLARSCKCKVYGIEEKENAFELEKLNRRKFGAWNIDFIHGKAPEALSELPEPDAVFIGGSEGKLFEIIDVVFAKNKDARVLVSAVTVETLSLCEKYCSERNLEYSVVQIAASISKKVGKYHLMNAENPIFLIKIQSNFK